MIPINLGAQGTMMGGRMPILPRRPTEEQTKPPTEYDRSAQAYGLAEALQAPEITSGTWGEALAEGLAGGLRGRAARDMMQGQQDQQSWADALEAKQGAASAEQERLLNEARIRQIEAEIANGGAWQHGPGYSHLWRPNEDGTVTLGDPLPLRPRAPTAGSATAPGGIPEGFVLD